ncbi:MAG: discoidin domain-containing protein [Pseudomonadota bacterium]
MEEKLLPRISHPLAMLVWVVLALSACGPAPAPAPVDEYQISVSADAANLDGDMVGVSQAADGSSGGGQYWVTGGPGSVPPDSRITITNMRTGDTVSVTPNPDGSFAGKISAQSGDKLQILVYQNQVSSLPTYVYVGAFNIKNVYAPGGYWYVGQVHFHSTHSDGKNTPQVMEAAYHDAGYHFVVSTDHRGTQPWYIADTHGMTPDPDNSATGKNLLWIRGSELGFGSVHMGAWGQELRTPISFTDSAADIQSRIDHVRSYRGLAVINHPHNEDPPYAWDWRQEISKVRRYSFVEAFNGNHSVSEGGSFGLDHTPTAIDLADEFRQVWWVGADDCHDMGDPSQFDRYAIVVRTDSAVISQKDLLANADAGNMYIRESARGPAIASVTVEGNTITLVMEDVASRYDVVWKKRGNEIVKSSDRDVDTTASYTVEGNEGYVRAEITRKDDGKRAYTQPLFIANNVDLASAVTISGGNNGDKLIDNNRNTFWQAPSGVASFVVDVGSVRQVNAIKIDWYRASGDTRRFNYKVETSATGAFGGEQAEVVRETYSNSSALTLDFFDEYARYVKVTVTSQTAGLSGAARISEVQVFDSSPARTNLYVDNVQGTDGNSGLVNSPWRTFDYARDRARPRDTVHLVNSGVPFAGGLTLRDTDGGKHPLATVRYEGDRNTFTQINAAGTSFGVRFLGTMFFEWMYFDIYSALDTNMVVSGKQGSSILFNKIRDSARRGVSGTGQFTFRNNLVYRNSREGLFLYQDGTDAEVYSNDFYANWRGVVLAAYNVKATVKNNIFARHQDVALYQQTLGQLSDGYNCVDGAYFGSWQRTGNIEADPKFVDPDNGDFRLQPFSPCIDAGIDLNFQQDVNGNPAVDEPSVPNRGSPGDYSRDYVDMGAYEYVP